MASAGAIVLENLRQLLVNLHTWVILGWRFRSGLRKGRHDGTSSGLVIHHSTLWHATFIKFHIVGQLGLFYNLQPFLGEIPGVDQDFALQLCRLQ